MKIFNFLKNKRNLGGEINPDEIFLDSSNLPQFDTDQFEGRLERPISKLTLIVIGSFFLLIVLMFTTRLMVLQVVRGEELRDKSENNRLNHDVVFADRGIIYDRKLTPLAANVVSDEDDFAHRDYIDVPGFSHVLGYIRYPSKDKNGFYYQTEFEGLAGIEGVYNKRLSGKNGVRIVETDALGDTQSQSVIEPPKNGDNIKLTIDARFQEKLFEYISKTATEFGFQGGAGVIMDVDTGELLALASYPEYDSEFISNGTSTEKFNLYTSSSATPFLNRVVSGRYTPGSIIKPFVSVAALEEGVIDPRTNIHSSGRLEIPNRYFPENPTIFTDWKAHGYVDMREAIAVSSNIYFYQIGGGYKDQKGLGIANIEKYMKKFGLDEKTNIKLSEEKLGVIPNPEWKSEVFGGDDWRVGDTYLTAIGQYGFQVTPISIVRAVASLANGGKLLEPRLLAGGQTRVSRDLGFSPESLRVVKEGMREAVLEGTASGLDVESIEVAAKTGTAELGVSKSLVNSWSVGFFPYDVPKYAFVVIMEKGPRDNSIGGTYVMRQLLDWMRLNNIDPSSSF